MKEMYEQMKERIAAVSEFVAAVASLVSMLQDPVHVWVVEEVQRRERIEHELLLLLLLSVSAVSLLSPFLFLVYSSSFSSLHISACSS